MRIAHSAGQNGEVLILCLDELVPLAEQLGLSQSLSSDKLELEAAVVAVARAYGPLVTHVVLSPEVGYAAAEALPPTTGSIFCLERSSQENDPFSIPVLQTNWSTEYVRNSLSSAKLGLSLQSQEAELVTKLELTSELHDSCRYEGIDLLLDLHLIDGDRLDDEAFQQEQLRLIQLFRGQSEYVVVEYPRSAISCLSVTAQLQQPWLLREPRSEYPELKESLRTALTGGAVGLVVSRCVLPTFKEGAFDIALLQKYLETEGRDRLLELMRICSENTNLPA